MVRAYDKPVKTNHKGAGSREKNKLANKNVKKTVSDKSGYIIWKDRKVVIIYTNDLFKTPKKDFLYSSDEQDTIDGGECFGGFSKLERWDDDNNLNRSVFLSPAPIVLYNMYMNEVDLMDQRIESNMISRRERRISTLLYTHVLDLSMNNAYAIYLWCIDNDPTENEVIKKLSCQDFRISVAEALCIGNRNNRLYADRKKLELPVIDTTLSEINEVGENIHYCLPTQKLNQLYCYVCLNFYGKSFRRKFACPVCKVGFCKDGCHDLFHKLDSMVNIRDSLVSKNKDKINPCIPLVDSIKNKFPDMTDDMIKCITSTETDYVDDIVSDNKNKLGVKRATARKARKSKRKAVTQDDSESDDESKMDGMTEEEIEKENEEWKRYIISNMSDNEDEVDEN